jgi:hypothetical protein
MTSAEQPAQSTYADRVFRSPTGIAGGVLLLVITLWIGGDALFRGSGRTPWLALGGMLLVVPLVVAFTLRPAVFAGSDRLRIRNPFRTITLPWGAVKELKAGYSTEAFTEEGGRFTLWAVPVSLRQRKRAASRPKGRSARGGSPDRMSAVAEANDHDVRMAVADRTVADLRELAERAGDRPAARGGTAVRWAYEVMGPALAGFVILIVLLATG